MNAEINVQWVEWIPTRITASETAFPCFNVSHDDPVDISLPESPSQKSSRSQDASSCFLVSHDAPPHSTVAVASEEQLSPALLWLQFTDQGAQRMLFTVRNHDKIYGRRSQRGFSGLSDLIADGTCGFLIKDRECGQH